MKTNRIPRRLIGAKWAFYPLIPYANLRVQADSKDAIQIETSISIRNKKDFLEPALDVIVEIAFSYQI